MDFSFLPVNEFKKREGRIFYANGAKFNTIWGPKYIIYGIQNETEEDFNVIASQMILERELEYYHYI